MHCRRMHHSLLHLVVSEFADVQATLMDASHVSDVLFATAWVNLHTAEGRRVEVRALLDQESELLFPSPFVGLCERHNNAPISKYIDLGKIIPAMRGQRLCSA